jgi:hypothetical protein
LKERRDYGESEGIIVSVHGNLLDLVFHFSDSPANHPFHCRRRDDDKAFFPKTSFCHFPPKVCGKNEKKLPFKYQKRPRKTPNWVLDLNLIPRIHPSVD